MILISEVCDGHPSSCIVNYEKQDAKHKAWIDEARKETENSIEIPEQSEFVEELLPFTGSIYEHLTMYVEW